MRLHTGSTERGPSAGCCPGFLTVALSMALSSGRRPLWRRDRSKRLPSPTLRRPCYPRNSPLGAGLQLVDQRLDLAAVILDVGIEVGTSSHDHADALDLHIG